MMKKMKLCLPVGWRMIKARYLFRFSRGYTIGRADMGDTGVACIHYGDIHGDYHFAIDINTARLGRIDEPLRFGVSEYVSAGQFLFAGSSEDYEGSGNFTLIRGNRSAIAGTDTIVLTPYSDMDVDYTAYLFDSLFFREQIRPHMMGTKVFHPSQKVIKSAWCIVPPQNESRQIVQYLNHEILWIDGLIEKLRREVELLEQYRRELIAHTVTRGLNPDASIQDSGIDWIGDGPSDWNHFSAKSLFVRRTELERKDDIHLTPSQTYGVIPQEDFIKLSGTKPTLKLSETSKMRHVEPGDFIIHLRSFQGGLELSGFQGKVSGAYTVITPREPSMVNHSYFKWLFKSSPFIRGLASLTNQLRDGQSINFTTFSRTSYLVPPIEQQQQIAEFLDMKTSRIDSTISDINKQTALLGRYRKQVINDAVTGKIRVGKVA
jgi:hypothetical protein